MEQAGLPPISPSNYVQNIQSSVSSLDQNKLMNLVVSCFSKMQDPRGYHVILSSISSLTKENQHILQTVRERIPHILQKQEVKGFRRRYFRWSLQNKLGERGELAKLSVDLPCTKATVIVDCLRGKADFYGFSAKERDNYLADLEIKHDRSVSEEAILLSAKQGLAKLRSSDSLRKAKETTLDCFRAIVEEIMQTLQLSKSEKQSEKGHNLGQYWDLDELSFLLETYERSLSPSLKQQVVSSLVSIVARNQGVILEKIIARERLGKARAFQKTMKYMQQRAEKLLAIILKEVLKREIVERERARYEG